MYSFQNKGGKEEGPTPNLGSWRRYKDTRPPPREAKDQTPQLTGKVTWFIDLTLPCKQTMENTGSNATSRRSQGSWENSGLWGNLPMKAKTLTLTTEGAEPQPPLHQAYQSEV